MNVQWIPAHGGLDGNSAADQEAKRGTTMPQSTASMDLSSAAAAFKRHQQSIAEDRYLSDPHARVHRVFTGSEQLPAWQRDWPRDQCVMLAQVRTGHSPLVAAYLHRISAGTRPSARTATAPTRRSSIWCSSVRPTITPGGTPGQGTASLPTRDASGATWNGLGR